MTYLPEETYGNSECIDLRRIEIPGRKERDRGGGGSSSRGGSRRSSRERSRDRGDRRRSRSRDRGRGGNKSKKELMDEILRSERSKAAATGKDYATVRNLLFIFCFSS